MLLDLHVISSSTTFLYVFFFSSSFFGILVRMERVWCLVACVHRIGVSHWWFSPSWRCGMESLDPRCTLIGASNDHAWCFFTYPSYAHTGCASNWCLSW